MNLLLVCLEADFSAGIISPAWSSFQSHQAIWSVGIIILTGSLYSFPLPSISLSFPPPLSLSPSLLSLSLSFFPSFTFSDLCNPLPSRWSAVREDREPSSGGRVVSELLLRLSSCNSCRREREAGSDEIRLSFRLRRTNFLREPERAEMREAKYQISTFDFNI